MAADGMYGQGSNGSFGLSVDFQSNNAARIYSDASKAGRFKQFLAWLTGRPHKLLALNDITCCDVLLNCHYGGAQVVDIEKIRGSESRTDDFDDEFNPVRENTRERWLRIARAFMRGESLPPVDLIQVDDIYFVRDGHHRVSAARKLGMHYIDAEVTIMQLRKMPL
jgi:hypothetical protein